MCHEQGRKCVVISGVNLNIPLQEHTLRRGYRFFPERLTGTVGMWIARRIIHIGTGAKVGKNTNSCNSIYPIKKPAGKAG